MFLLLIDDRTEVGPSFLRLLSLVGPPFCIIVLQCCLLHWEVVKNAPVFLMGGTSLQNKLQGILGMLEYETQSIVKFTICTWGLGELECLLGIERCGALGITIRHTHSLVSNSNNHRKHFVSS